MNTIKVKVSQLTNKALDYLVAGLEGCLTSHDKMLQFEQARVAGYNGLGQYTPACLHFSESWEEAGPIIERESMQLTPCEDMQSWSAGLMFRQGCEDYEGPTPLISAMRCYVASRLGDIVQVPKELLS